MSESTRRGQIHQIFELSQSDPDRAVTECDKAIGDGIDSAAIWLLKARVHFNRDEHTQAAEAFSNVVRLKPQYGLASLGLFHSYWDAGNTDAAFDEMKRYFRTVGFDADTATAKDYAEIIRELDG